VIDEDAKKTNISRQLKITKRARTETAHKVTVLADSPKLLLILVHRLLKFHTGKSVPTENLTNKTYLTETGPEQSEKHCYVTLQTETKRDR